MPLILSLSSQVARGHVGNSASGFVWQRLGFEVIALPTVVLSNRPDYSHCAGESLSAARLDAMLGALDANGFLDGLDAVFTGYLPGAEHFWLAARWVDRLKARHPGLLYCCDPILGDEPDGLYIAEPAAAALRDELVPRAGILTPNAFELGWLSGRRIDTAEDAITAARALAGVVLATSAPGGEPDALANIAVSGSGAWRAVSARRRDVPHGTGDLIAALFLAHMMRGHDLSGALALAAGGLEAVVEASAGRDELALVATQNEWADAAPWPVKPLTGNAP